MNEGSISIRPANTQDAEIVALFNQRMAWETEQKKLSEELVKPGSLEGITNPDRCRYFIAEINANIAGQAMVTYEWSDWRNGEFWWLQSVYVAPQYRGRGVFREILSHIEAQARATKQVCGLRLYVENDNELGQTVYNRLGLSDAGYRVFEKEF